MLGGSTSVHLDGGSGATDGGNYFVGDPATCEQAASNKSYVGCDFWPTVTANSVWPIFDFTVVVANTQDTAAQVSIERNGSVIGQGTVPANGLQKFFLPWVDALKGPPVTSCGYLESVLDTSVRATGGAYHLTSSVPVTVYQFSALEYKGQGGPDGKDWSQCPASSCPGLSCLSYSNDASLLLPTTVLTGNYRITGMRGWQYGQVPPYFAVTGTKDGTKVTVKVSGSGQVSAGNDIIATASNGILEFSLDRGDVVEVVGTATTDLSGSLLQASAPVQVIAGMACVYLPNQNKACDHIEESVFPAETLGKHYFVPRPTGPNGDTPGHIVRIYGNVDQTHLTYSSKPPNAPDIVQAGDVFDLDVVTQDFEVSGDHEFAVASFELGSSVVDPLTPYELQKGDPAQSQLTAVEQFRKKYVFLAPDDYDVSYVDIVLPDGASLVLDGQSITPVSATDFQWLLRGSSEARSRFGGCPRAHERPGRGDPGHGLRLADQLPVSRWLEPAPHRAATTSDQVISGFRSALRCAHPLHRAKSTSCDRCRRSTRS